MSKKLTLKETKSAIIENTELINKDYKVSHFEFVKNKDNWPLIRKFFEDKGFEIEVSRDNALFRNNNVLLNHLFWIDLEKIYKEKINSYYKDIGKNAATESLNYDSPFYINNKKKPNEADYRFHEVYDNVYMRFIIRLKNGNMHIETKPLFENGYESLPTDKIEPLYNKLKALFTCSTIQKMPADKENIGLFLDKFLFDTEKMIIISEKQIYSMIRDLSPVKYDTANFMLSQNFSEEFMIDTYLKNYKNVIDKNTKIKIIFDREQNYINSLGKDIVMELSGNIDVKQNYHSNELRFKFYGAPVADYSIEIKNDNVHLIKDNKNLASFDIKKGSVKDLIVDNIRESIKKVLKNKRTHESVEKCLYSLRHFFKDTNIDVKHVPFSEIEIEDFTIHNIPFLISHKDEVLKIVLNVSENHNFEKNPQLNSFKEKIKIKALLDNDAFKHDLMKKRI